MNFKQLISLSDTNDVRIDNFRGYKQDRPHYYESLRHAFNFYFKTFITNNTHYSFYAEGLYKKNVRILKHQFLDQENTVLTIVAFERFFELFLKDLLGRVNKKMILVLSDTNNNGKLVSVKRLRNGVQEFINGISNGNYVPKMIERKPLSIPFRETIDRFYELLDFSVRNPNSNSIVKKFSKLIAEYSFLDSIDYKATFQYLNWYRDRILHNGNKLPSLWLLDYTITQRVIPIVNELINVDSQRLGIDFFYFKTVTGIDILAGFDKVKFEFKDLKSKGKHYDSFIMLLKIGHLKELGRANMNMNLFVRMNRATYEYNYHDPKGRGIRFALAEKKHPDFKKIPECPCCGVKSLVLYQLVTDDLFNPGQKMKIDWVKCYTCDYHLRYDTGEPYLMELYTEPLFMSKKAY